MFAHGFSCVPVILTVACGSAWLSAADAQPAAEPATADIARWIRQLDAEQFSARTEASQALQNAGRAAIPALAETTRGGSREASLRAFDILKNFFQNGDEPMKAAVRETLQKIASSDHAATARRAKEILEPKPPAAAQAMMNPFGVPAQIQIQVNAGAGGGQTRRVRIQNGQKEIEVSENNRKVKINDGGDKGIQLEVTETKDGKEQTQKYSAKNEAELKKQHPEAHKLYEKYSQQPGGIQIQGLQLQPGAIPAIPMPVPVQGIEVSRRIAASQLRHARAMIESASKSLERAKENATDADALGKTIKNLEDIIKRLGEETEKLGAK